MLFSEAPLLDASFEQPLTADAIPEKSEKVLFQFLENTLPAGVLPFEAVDRSAGPMRLLIVGGVSREQKLFKEHLPRVIYHRVHRFTKMYAHPFETA